MLINNILTERRPSLIVKDSAFYIEIAKFVQAYTTIVKNPNEFLPEVGEPQIDDSKERLTWSQLVKILQTCDLGFAMTPTVTDLVVYYNYALEIGSVDALDKKIATVNDVAEAQKHYYNFVDEAKSQAEEAYLKQKKIVDARQREVNYVDKQLAKIKAKNCFAVIMMFFAVLLGMSGVVGFFFEESFVATIGKLVPIWKPQYIGGIILICLMLIIFYFSNRLFIKSKRELKKLKDASLTIFRRNDETRAEEQVLKNKLDKLDKDYEVVQNEINDKTKKYDVKQNINQLKVTNKYYQKLCGLEEEFDVETAKEQNAGDDEEVFAPIKLTKEQEENLRTVSKEAINLEGQLDREAFIEKFEHTEKDEERKKEREEKDAEEEKQQLLDSVDYIKDILGMSEENKKLDNQTKEKEENS